MSFQVRGKPGKLLESDSTHCWQMQGRYVQLKPFKAFQIKINRKQQNVIYIFISQFSDI